MADPIRKIVKPAFWGLSISVLCCGSASAALEFSWDTIPRAIIFRDHDRTSDEAVTSIANNYQLVVLEKSNEQGLDYSEEGMSDVASRLKAVNPDIVNLAYWNSYYCWPSYEACIEFYENYESWSLDELDTRGRMRLRHARGAMREWWVRTALGLYNSPGIDGLFFDTLRDNAQTMVSEFYSQVSTDAITMGNGTDLESYWLDDFSGTYMEGWSGSADTIVYTIDTLRDHLARGMSVFLRTSPGHTTNFFADPKPTERADLLEWVERNVDFPLAVFLMIAEEQAYFRYADSVQSIDGEDSLHIWDTSYMEVFGKPLGAPLGGPVQSGYWYTRSFEYLDVSVNVESGDSRFQWHEKPKAYWSLHEGSGTVANDLSGNDYHGTITDGSWVTGVEGNALEFNGSTSEVTLPAAAFSEITNEISIAMWVYGDTTQPRPDSVFHATDALGNRVLNIHLPWSNSNVYWDAGTDGTIDRVNKVATTSDFMGQWNHWVFTKNASTGEMKIYLNGSLWHTGTGNVKTMSGITAATLGSNTSGQYYDGMINDVRLYNVALDEAKVAYLYDHNIAPLASTQNVVAPVDAATAITLTGFDAEGDSLTYALVTSPTNGTLSGTAPNLIYTPDAGYYGSDSLTYKVNDGTMDSATVTVSIKVNTTPVATALTETLQEDSSTSVTLAGSDVDGDGLTYSIVTAPTNGSLSGTVPNLIYTPNADYNGPDSFTYTASDGSTNSAAATVSITVTAVGDVPVADAQSVVVGEDGSLAIILTGSDVDGDSLTYAVASTPVNGTLSGTAPNLTYRPNVGFIGTDSFTYSVNDGEFDSAVATVSITVYVAVAEWTLDDGNGTVISDISGNNYDGLLTDGIWVPGIEGTALEFNGSTSRVTLPAEAFSSISNQITLAMWVYGDTTQPRADSVFYASDASGNRVLNIHLPWSASTVYWDAGNSGGMEFDRIEKVAETSDFMGQWNHWVFTKSATTGEMKIYLNGALWHVGTGNVKTMSGITTSMLGGQISSYSYDGMIDDVKLYDVALNETDVAELYAKTNHAPVANHQSISVDEDDSVAITLTGSDANGDSLTYTVVTAPTNGILSGTAPALIFTPNADYNGSDSFTYTVNDGTVNSAVATVSITVTTVNDAPVFSVDPITGTGGVQNNAYSGSLSATDVDGDSLSYSAVSGPAWLTVASDGSLSGTPLVEDIGSNSWTVEVSDGNGGTNQAVLNVTVAVDPYTPALDWSGTSHMNVPYKTVDGQVLNVDIYLPDTLEPSPVVIYTHGGGWATGDSRNVGGGYMKFVGVDLLEAGIAVVSVTYRYAGEGDGMKSCVIDSKDAYRFISKHAEAYNIDRTKMAAWGDSAGAHIAMMCALTDNDQEEFIGDTELATYNDYEIKGCVSWYGPVSFRPEDADGWLAAGRPLGAFDGRIFGDETDPEIQAYEQNLISPINYMHRTSLPVYMVHGVDDTTIPIFHVDVMQDRADTVGNAGFAFKKVLNAGHNFRESGELSISPKWQTLVELTVNKLVSFMSIPPKSDGIIQVTGARNSTTGGSSDWGTFTGTTFVVDGADGTAPGGQGLIYEITDLNLDGDATADKVVIRFNVTAGGAIKTASAGYLSSPGSILSSNGDWVQVQNAGVDVYLNGVLDEAVTAASGMTELSVGLAGWRAGEAGTINGVRRTWTDNVEMFASADNRTISLEYESDSIGDWRFSDMDFTIGVNVELPTAISLSETMLEGDSTSVKLVGLDADGDTLSFTVVTVPENGILTGTAPNLIYTPDTGFTGSDSFTYTVSDGEFDSAVAAVSFKVLAAGLMGHWALDETSGTAVVDSSGNGFDATLVGGTWTTGYNGGALDFNANSDSVALPAEPLSVIDDQITIAMWVFGDTTQPRSDTLFEAIDGGGNRMLNIHLPWSGSVVYWDAGNEVGTDRISKTANAVDFMGQWNHWVFTKDASTGVMKIYLNGVLWHSEMGMTQSMSGITAAALGSGVSGLNYDGMIDDVRLYNIALTDEEAALVYSSGNIPPVANALAETVDEDGSVGLILTGLDSDGDSLTFAVASFPVHGSLSGSAPNLTYTPHTDYNGFDSFTYTVNDGKVDSDTATVALTVDAVNDGPAADAKSVVVNEDELVAVTLSGSDVDGDSLTYMVVTAPTNGSLSGTDSNLSYTPNADYNGSDSFTYTVNDGSVNSAAATVSITVTAVNDAPVFSADPIAGANGMQNSAFSGNLSATDIDGDSLSYSAVSGPSWLTVAADGALSGTPLIGDIGANTWTVAVSDGNGGTAQAVLNVTVDVDPNPAVRVTEYYLTTGDFSGTTATVTLDQDLADDYFILVRGSHDGDGLSEADNNYARVTAVPDGNGELSASGAANQIVLGRYVADFDWEGVVTVVECVNSASAAGFKLVDIVETSLTGTSGADTSMAWNDMSQVALLGGYRGGGASLAAETTDSRNQGTSVFARLYPSGTNTLNWSRNAAGETLVDAVMTTFVVEWGSEWTVQHVNVVGSNGGNGADVTSEYTTASISSVSRANSWVWATGTRADAGIGDNAEACLVTLGDGVSQNAMEASVAVGSEYTDAYDFDVYVLTHPAIAVDYRFVSDGNKSVLDLPVTVDAAAAGTRFGWSYNGVNGTGTWHPRDLFWARYTSDSEITISRGFDGQTFPAWVQGIDLSGLNQ